MHRNIVKLQGAITEQGASIAALTATTKVLQATVPNLLCIHQTKYQPSESAEPLNKTNKAWGTFKNK